MKLAAQKGMKIDNIVLNAGVLRYPNVGSFLPTAGYLTDVFAESHRDVSRQREKLTEAAKECLAHLLG